MTTQFDSKRQTKFTDSNPKGLQFVHCTVWLINFFNTRVFLMICISFLIEDIPFLKLGLKTEIRFKMPFYALN